MKKLSILVALLLCVTIGGVYATWTYNSESADITDITKEVVIELENASTEGAAGTFSVSTNLALKLDQAEYEGNVNPHKAKILYESTDGNPIQMVVTFTPSVNATPAVRANAVPAELYFSTTTDMTYPAATDGTFDSSKTDNMKSILKFSNMADGTFNGNPSNSDYVADKAVVWEGPHADGSFTATYDANKLQQMITLGGENGNLFLRTKSDYDSFKTNYLTGNIVVHITDGTVQSSGGGDQG